MFAQGTFAVAQAIQCLLVTAVSEEISTNVGCCEPPSVRLQLENLHRTELDQTVQVMPPWQGTGPKMGEASWELGMVKGFGRITADQPFESCNRYNSCGPTPPFLLSCLQVPSPAEVML